MAFQSGISVASPMGSMTAPDRMCAPTSEPFSSTTTDSSLPGRGGELLQADGGGKAGGARPDDHHVEVHRLARREVGSHVPSGALE